MTHDELIRAIHGSGYQLVLATTGGGASAIGDLFRVPGGSASVLEAVVPYSWNSLVDWLGGQPDNACSSRTARAMAMAAFQRARALAESNTPISKLLGIGCTASLASDRPKRGTHRFYIAFQGHSFTGCFGWELTKGERTRAEEERVVCDLLLHFTAFFARVSPAMQQEPLANLRPIASESADARPAIRELLVGAAEKFAVQFDSLAATAPRVLFPGAFNPLHAGHRHMAQIAQTRLHEKVAFEISVTNVDKPPLDYYEIEHRLQGFDRGDQVWLTRAPTFVEKAALFPGVTFLVGADTIRRIADEKYYGGSVNARDQAVAALAAHQARFLVFGRLQGEHFETLASLPLPEPLRQLCEEVPEADFREDLSSTALRTSVQASAATEEEGSSESH